MKMNILRITVGIAGIFGLITSMTTLAADTVFLTNGDKISGTIKEMGTEKIVINTPYTEDIEIYWRDISNMKTDEKITILKSDSTRVEGKIDSVRSGEITLGGSSGSTLNIDEISKINPAPKGIYVGTGDFNVGGFLSRGNTEKGSLHIDTEYIYQNELNRFTIGGNYDLSHDYDEIHDEARETSNNLRVYGNYDRFLDANWYVYAGADFSKDRFQNLDYRITGGAGLGYQFWNDSDKFLSFEAGPGYTYEVYTSRFINVNGLYQDKKRKSNYANARWAIDFHHWFLDERIQFFHNHDGIVGLEKTELDGRADDHDILIRSHTGIKVPVYDNFHILAQFDYDWKRYPVAGNEHEDFRYILGVGYAW